MIKVCKEHVSSGPSLWGEIIMESVLHTDGQRRPVQEGDHRTRLCFPHIMGKAMSLMSV